MFFRHFRLPRKKFLEKTPAVFWHAGCFMGPVAVGTAHRVGEHVKQIALMSREKVEMKTQMSIGGEGVPPEENLMDVLALMTPQEAESHSPALAPALACIKPFVEYLDDPRILASPRKRVLYLSFNAMPSRYTVNDAEYWDALVTEAEAQVTGYARSKNHWSTSDVIAWTHTWDLLALRIFIDEVVEELKRRGTISRS